MWNWRTYASHPAASAAWNRHGELSSSLLFVHNGSGKVCIGWTPTGTIMSFSYLFTLPPGFKHDCLHTPKHRFYVNERSMSLKQKLSSVFPLEFLSLFLHLCEFVLWEHFGSWQLSPLVPFQLISPPEEDSRVLSCSSILSGTSVCILARRQNDGEVVALK